jgi:hypothetical protein
LGLPALSKKGAAETADSPIQTFAPRTCFKALSRSHDGGMYEQNGHFGKKYEIILSGMMFSPFFF